MVSIVHNDYRLSADNADESYGCLPTDGPRAPYSGAFRYPLPEQLIRPTSDPRKVKVCALASSGMNPAERFSSVETWTPTEIPARTYGLCLEGSNETTTSVANCPGQPATAASWQARTRHVQRHP